jgi:hypothetical protein
VPFLGSGQNNFYYPPNALFLVLPVDRAFGILVCLHLLLAAGGMYRLSRSYVMGRDASVVAGAAFGMSFCLIARFSAGHLPNFITVCQAPLLLLLVRRAVCRPGAGRLSALSAGGALAIAGGAPQILYQLALLCAALALSELWTLRREHRPILPSLGILAAGAAGALSLSAVQLLPLLETASNSNRDAASADLIRPFHDFNLLHLVMLTVPRFFWHGASDPWLWREKTMYLGILPL